VQGVIRLVDDSLFASTAPSECADFLKTMHGGFPEYGCEANLDKSRCSMTPGLRDELRGAVPEAGFEEPSTGQVFFSWCGLLVGAQGPLVQKDYSACARRSVIGDLRFGCARATGMVLAAKLRQTIHVRCHPIFVDPCLADERTALLNVYQGGTFAALRLVALSRHLPHVNERFVAELVRRTVAFSAGLLARKRAQGDAGLHARLQLLTRWLGLTAFSRILQRRQPSMRRVIAELDASLRAPGMLRVFRAEGALLRAASDDALSSAKGLRQALAR